MPSKDVITPIPEVSIHLFITRPGNNQLRIRKSRFNITKLDLFINETVFLNFFPLLVAFILITPQTLLIQ